MAVIRATNMEIAIEDGFWRLYQKSDRFTPPLLFESLQGSGVIQYKSNFGTEIGLPGTKLATNFVRAVVVGYEKNTLRWRLGLHVAETPEEKPRWVPLVSWDKAPNEQYATQVQQAGRALAEYIGCPLKIFGVKKMAPAPTGPLEEHSRKDVDAYEVQQTARRIDLPIESQGSWLGEGRNKGLTLRIAREGMHPEAGKDAPAYQQCDIDPKKEVIKLIPPTGLLGAFFGGARGREIAFKAVRNVELRHVIEVLSTTRPDDATEGMLTEVSTILHSWRIYLTLRDESILLAMNSHKTSSELTRQRGTGVTDKKSTVEYRFNVSYYQQLEQDQKAKEAAARWAERTAICIAATLNINLVMTQVGKEV